jgi:ADP-ribosyl-[dinitrogen reductase] hydrolase
MAKKAPPGRTPGADGAGSPLQDRFRGCLLGLAVGDAIGTSVEFKPRGTFEPVTDMVGGGPFGLQAGQWTDDTSMALCLATSLVEKGFDLHDQMVRYNRWRKEGYLSSTGTCFDVGTTVAQALARFRDTGNPLQGSSDPKTAGNGCIMRLAPVPMFYFPDESLAGEQCAKSCLTTHGTAECLDAAHLFGRMLVRALGRAAKESILNAGAEISFASPGIVAIATGAFLEKPESQIRGSGYVVESLEAALWCFARTHSYADAVLAAVNLGDDADTTGAVVGQLAGGFYGSGAIPPRWRHRLCLCDRITSLADALWAKRDETVR